MHETNLRRWKYANTISLRKLFWLQLHLQSCRQLEYDTLKSLQLKVIMSFPAGMDVFAILPTGYGKRLCYALLPLLFDGLYRLQGDCCSCFLNRNFHPDRACYLATGLPVESGTSFLRSLDDFEMSLAQPMQ